MRAFPKFLPVCAVLAMLVCLWLLTAPTSSRAGAGQATVEEAAPGTVEVIDAGPDLSNEATGRDLSTPGAETESGTGTDTAAETRVSVLVHFERPAAAEDPATADARRQNVKAWAVDVGGHVQYEYDVVLPNVINLRGIPQSSLETLGQLPGVLRVEEDRTLYAHLSVSTPLIRALQSQITGAGHSADGTGVRVCILDTGIDSDHIMYSTRIDTAAGRDFVNNDNNPEDDNGHGSNVAGIAVGGTGLSLTRCSVSTTFQGVAPEATLIGIKVLNQNGGGSFSDVIAGINYGADQSASGGRCDVMNLSLGGGAFGGNCDGDSAAAAANNAVDAGVVVVSSSGNECNSNAMGTPACGSKVIAVGAVYDDDFSNCEFPTQNGFTWCCDSFCFSTCTDNGPSQDSLVCFSNESSTIDVTAPGCVSTSADNAPGGTTVSGQCGTSQASPHVAGLAALILDADGSLTPGDVRQIIRDGAIDLGPAGFDSSYGWGRIDAINSLDLVSGGCTSDPDCDDGLFCNGPETCHVPSGTCQPGTAPSCDDGVACTDDSCNEATDSCDNVSNDANCDNGLFCDGAETCDAVLGCQPGTSVDCDDSVACTVDSCNETTDSCDNTPDNAACDDGLFCNGAETCNAALGCEAGGDPCPGQSCDEANDTCVGCVTNGDCDDGLFCNGVETCDAGTCQAGTPVSCGDGVTCTDDSCNEATDSCDNVANNANCDNGLFCDGAETCDAVLDCQAGTAPDCDDGVGCTDDSCNEATDSCDNAVNNASCDNGLFCDGAETCDAVLDCQAGTAVDCDDAVACTVDSCNDTTDSCDNQPSNALCDDGLFCTGVEACDPVLGCQAGTDPCLPGEACNEATDACDPSACNDNGTCESGEDCNNCSGDCPSGSGTSCGNGVCEAGDGEDCVSCPADCNGLQSGKPQNRFCCGDGDGQNPLSCSDSLCSVGGFSCTDQPAVPSCCGDLVCEGTESSANCQIDCGAPPSCGNSICEVSEDPCSCAADCGTPPPTESSCTDAFDNDCDGFTDCNDADCSVDPACACAPKGDPCSVDADCCSLSCKNNGTCR